MKSLIVESSRVFAGMFSAMIQQGGMDVELAASGQQALDMLVKKHFDFVCTSMVLKDTDGVALAHAIRERGLIEDRPLVMVTSSEDRALLAGAISSGVTEVFRKDNLELLREYVSQFVMLHGRAEKLSGKVLYVEDTLSVAEKTKALLRSAGLQVTHFVTAEEALTSFHDEAYDLVLTDLMLAGDMSGNALLRHVRATEGSKGRVPTLVMTGFDDSARKIELLRSGASDYIPKPYIDEELLVRVANHLTNKRLVDRIESQQKRMHELAMKDQLTGLYNRHYLMEAANAKLSEAARHKFACALVIVDADKFKSINDTHGHQAGDVVLQELGGVLKDACRKEDIAARFGGEEFVLLLSHCTAEDACAKADRIRRKIAELMPAGLKVTASFGVAALEAGERAEFSELFKVADEAVYQAKERGRNQVVLGQAVQTSFLNAVG